MPPQRDPVLFLIDGYALIYRAFFAMIGRPLTTSRGENTSASWGVANFLLRLFEKHHPTHIVWVHDAGTSFRNETYEEYKATREKLDDELQQDFDQSVLRIEEILEAFRVPLVAVDGYEADDVIGTLAVRASERGLHTVIVSGDKDFYQLVSEKIRLLNPGRGGPASVEEHWVDPSNAADRLGVPPERVVDYLALVGDSSDNVPGVRGVGDKTARALIGEYGDLDAILSHASEVKGKRAREALAKSAEDARLSRDLVTIRRDVPVDLDLKTFEVGAPDTSALRKLFAELEFHSLLPKLASQSIAKDVAFTVIDSPSGLEAMIREVRGAGGVAMLVEASEPDPLRGEVVGISLATRDGSWYLPLAHGRADGELGGGEEVSNLPPLTGDAMKPVADLLADAAVRKTGHDVKRDWLALRRAGIELAGVEFDVMLASFLVDPGRRTHALDALALDYLSSEIRSRAELLGQGKGARPFTELPVEEAGVFSCGSCETMLRLRDTLATQLAAHSLTRLYEEVELPLTVVLVDMEWRGIAVDVDGLRALSQRFGEELEALERAIHQAAGTEFNIGSTHQLRHVLFEKLQLPVLKKTKTGPSTDADVLAELAATGYDVPKLLLEYRELTKLRSTYVDVLPESINPETGRIHTSFNQAGAATGRLSSSDPNLQNIPIRTPRGELIRQCFVPGPGCRFIVADYSQIELRLLAHLSEDPAFIGAFERGGDIHRETAAIVFDVSLGEVTSEMRARAKTINFATIYGQGPFALSRQLGITQEEAKDFITRYFERLPEVRRFLDRSIELARERGYAETIRSRRRYIPELKDRNFNVRSFGERTAMNSPLQGSAADLIKVAMINLAAALSDAGLETAILLQVHDELVLEAPEPEIEEAQPIVRREMEGAAVLRVPLVVDIGVGWNWLDAKKQDLSVDGRFDHY